MVMIRHSTVVWDRRKIQALIESTMPQLVEEIHKELASNRIDLRKVLAQGSDLTEVLRLLRTKLGKLVRSSVYEQSGQDGQCAALAFLVATLSSEQARNETNSDYWD